MTEGVSGVSGVSKDHVNNVKYMCEVIEVMDDRDSASTSSYSDDIQAGEKPEGDGSGRSIAKSVTGVPCILNLC